jgi:cysteine protease ATG4
LEKNSDIYILGQHFPPNPNEIQTDSSSLVHETLSQKTQTPPTTPTPTKVSQPTPINNNKNRNNSYNHDDFDLASSYSPTLPSQIELINREDILNNEADNNNQFQYPSSPFQTIFLNTSKDISSSLDAQLVSCSPPYNSYVTASSFSSSSHSSPPQSQSLTLTNLDSYLNKTKNNTKDQYLLIADNKNKQTKTSSHENNKKLNISSLVNENMKTKFEQEVYTRVWFTYRKDFLPINGNFRYTSDCGWGCMIRSAQMLMGEAMLRHFFGLNWSIYRSFKEPNDIQMYKTILSFFNDRPSVECPLGLHYLMDVADEKVDKNGNSNQGEKSRVGTWFGPTSICILIRDALNKATQYFEKTQNKKKELGLLKQFKVYVARDCTIYKKDVFTLCYGDNEVNNENTSSSAGQVFKPCVILVSVRLGGEDLNEVYVPALKELLEMKTCIGIIGGRPKHSLYFFGYQSDKVIYLDPHFCQPFVNVSTSTSTKPAQTRSNKNDFSMLSSSSSESDSNDTTSIPNEYFDNTSFHCSTPNKISFLKIDPSLAIGFYCATRQDFDDLCDYAALMSEGMYPIFGVSKSSYEETQLSYQSPLPKSDIDIDVDVDVDVDVDEISDKSGSFDKKQPQRSQKMASSLPSNMKSSIKSPTNISSSVNPMKSYLTKISRTARFYTNGESKSETVNNNKNKSSSYQNSKKSLNTTNRSSSSSTKHHHNHHNHHNYHKSKRYSNEPDDFVLV